MRPTCFLEAFEDLVRRFPFRRCIAMKKLGEVDELTVLSALIVYIFHIGPDIQE